MATFQNTFPVGTILHSMLTLTQFQTAIGSLGNGWVLANGQSCVGSTYAAITGFTTVPDMRGRVLRGKNNGATTNPDGDLALGTLQADQFASHNHRIQQSGGGIGNGYATINSYQNTGYYNQFRDSNSEGQAPNGIAIESSGGNETRMKNVTVNIFIKIN